MPDFYVYRYFLRIVKRQKILSKKRKERNAMTIFEKVKSSVTPKDVARQYGLQANRSNMIDKSTNGKQELTME